MHNLQSGKCPFRATPYNRVSPNAKAFSENSSPEMGKAKNKKAELTLLIHPQWLQGCPKHDDQGREYGGSVTDSLESTTRWSNVRAAKLRLLEVRGKLPEQVTCPDTKVTFYTDGRGGTVPKKSNFACAADGSPNLVLDAIKASGRTGPAAAFAIQGHSPRREATGVPYSGRFFAAAIDTRAGNIARAEWEARKDADLRGFWPDCEIPFGHMTHQRQPLPDHGYTHWWKMFGPVQRLVHSQLLRAIVENASVSQTTKEVVLGGPRRPGQ